MFTATQIQEILDLYNKKNESTYTIARRYQTYPNKIRRVILQQGESLKDKSQAQKDALTTGRSKHPTEGTFRPETTKIKISEKVFKRWKNLSEEEYQKRVDYAKEQWYNMDIVKRETMRRNALKAMKQSAKEGSKLEQFLRNELTKAGYTILFHKKGLIVNPDLEIDLFLPSLKTAIEIDGFSHYQAIWGEEKLQQRIKSDLDKDGLLLGAGYVIIRIKYLVKNLSAKYKRDVLKSILEHLKNIEENFPEKGQRLITLGEAND